MWIYKAKSIQFMSCPVFPPLIRLAASTQHYSNPSYSFVYPFPPCCISSPLHPSFLSDVESAAVHSKQQVMDLARDLSWLWMSQPVGVRVGVQMDPEKPARKTHTLSLWDFSLSLSLLQKFNISAVPTVLITPTSVFKDRNKPAGQRGLSGRSGCFLFNPSSVAQANSLPSHFDLIFFPPAFCGQKYQILKGKGASAITFDPYITQI